MVGSKVVVVVLDHIYIVVVVVLLIWERVTTKDMFVLFMDYILTF